MKTNLYAKVLYAGVACSLMCGSVAAQDSGFDFSSQRSEKQDVLAVPGQKIDHHGLIVNPMPHQMEVAQGKICDLTKGIRLKDVHHTFAPYLQFLPQARKGVKLTIDFGGELAVKAGVKQVSGAYTLSIAKKSITITGYDERGAFYGIQTLRQLMESPAAAAGQLPQLQINDYPDLPNRGVVEGFYGTPWSHQVRLSLIDFYGKFKLNTYLYGPKDDPYHSSPNWRLPYPEKEANNIKELVEACNRNYVDFVWAIHPGQDIKWNEEDYRNLVNKFNWMYDLGVRHFAIFFDDISGEGTNPVKQTELLNRLTREFVQTHKGVAPLTVCPTDYSKLWANPTEKGSLAIYGKTLDPGIKVFWTGDVVCSDLTRETLDFINSRIKRPAYYWWNYPVTDYIRNFLLQGPVYGLDTTLTDRETCGVVSNPMEHGEASKLALYGVADYTWNIAGYNAIDNWERGLAEMVPQATEAYRTFAIHSADTENGYRRDESWETRTFRLDGWNDALADSLEQEFKRVETAPAILRQKCANKALLQELNPWLSEFAKLGTRGRKAIELARIYRSGQDEALFWNNYVQNIMTPQDRRNYEAHKSGTLKLQPFYENIMDDMAHGYLKKLSGQVPSDYKGIGSFATARTVQTKLMLDHDSITYYTSGIAQKPGDWIGVDLRAVRPVKEVSVLQGRNSKDDVDYFDHAVLEYSADGKAWKPLTGELDKQYVIHWNGQPVQARYVRLKRLDSKRTNYASVRSFEVNPLRPDGLGFALKADTLDKAVYAFDNNLATSYSSNGMLEFGTTPDVKAYTLLLNTPHTPVKCVQLDKNGRVLNESVLSSAYTRITPAGSEVAAIRLEGPVEIFEIVPVK